MVESEGEKFLNLTKAAQFLQVCRNTFYRNYASKLSYVKKGKRKFFSVAELEKLYSIQPPDEKTAL